MPLQTVGLNAIFSTSQFQAGLTQYQRGITQVSSLTSNAAQMMTAAMGGASNAMAVSLGGAASAAGLAINFLVTSLTKFGLMAFEQTYNASILAGSYDELRMVAQFMGQQAGYSQEKIEGVSKSLTDMGARVDVASQLIANFSRYNLDLTKSTDLLRVAQGSAIIAQEGTSQALTGIMHGILTYNQRMLRTYGIIIDVQAEQEKYAKSIGKTADALTGNEKIQSALNATLEAGASIAGLYDEAMKLPSKQLRTLADREIPQLQYALGDPFQLALLSLVQGIRQVAAELTKAFSVGGKLFPLLVNLGALASIAIDSFSGLAMTGITAAEKVGAFLSTSFDNILNTAFSWGENLISNFSQGIIDGISYYLNAAIEYVGSIISYWFAPGSPPRVAPNLNTWGKDALGEWLHGFTEVDFSGLKAIESPLKSVFDALFWSANPDEDAIGKKKSAQAYKDLMGGIMGALDVGSISGSLFNQIKDSTGQYGTEIVKLVQAEIDLALATDQATDAQTRLTQAEKDAENAGKRVNTAVHDYNSMLRAGVTGAPLDAKLKEVRVAESQRTLAEQQAAQAKIDLDAAKERLEIAKSTESVQKSILDQLLDVFKTEEAINKLLKERKGEAGTPTEDTGEKKGLGAVDLSKFNKAVDDAVAKAKANIESKLQWIWSYVQDWWSKDMVGGFDAMTKRTPLQWGEFFAPFAKQVGETLGEITVNAGKVFVDLQTIYMPMIIGAITDGENWRQLAKKLAELISPSVFAITSGFNDKVKDTKWWETFWYNGATSWDFLWTECKKTLDMLAIMTGTYLTEKLLNFDWVGALGKALGPAEPGKNEKVSPFGNLFLPPNPSTYAGHDSEWAAARSTMYAKITAPIPAEIETALNQNGMQVVDGIITGIDGSQIPLDEALRRIARKPGEVFTSIWQIHSPARAFVPTGQALVQGIVLGIQMDTIDLLAAVSTLISEVYTAERTAFDLYDWQLIGREIAGGLTKGIESKIADIANAATSAARAAVNAARDELKSESPSKVFIEIGKSTMEGLAQGITSNMGSPVRVAAYASAAVPMASTSIMHSSVSNNNMNMGPIYVSSPMNLAVLENTIARVLRRSK